MRVGLLALTRSILAHVTELGSVDLGSACHSMMRLDKRTDKSVTRGGRGESPATLHMRVMTCERDGRRSWGPDLECARVSCRKLGLLRTNGRGI